MPEIKAFLQRKDVIFSWDRYGLRAVSAMALGLFASLLTGVILETIATQCITWFSLPPDQPSFFVYLQQAGDFAKKAAGPAMAISIGYALHAPSLVLFSLAAVGISANQLGGAGGPLAVLFVAIVATELGKIVAGETKIDILVTPLTTVIAGVLLSLWWAPAIGSTAVLFGEAIKRATELQPFFMGVAVSVLVGIALTLPISSAAICAALGLTGLAGGAAVAGCCAQMVGFAVMSYRENRMAGLVAQGLGTSMLQFENILKKPLIWLPPTLASAITGPLATCLFRLEMNGPAVASGMGTCGLVGPIGVLSGWAKLGTNAGRQAPTSQDFLGLFLIALLLPALLTWLISGWMRKKGWIRPEDLRLQLK